MGTRQTRRRALKTVISGLVTGYLTHGDVGGALEMLQSASFREHCPPAESIRMLIRRGLIGEPTGRFESQEQRVLCYLVEAVDEGRLDPILGELLTSNPLFDQSAMHGGHRDGWTSDPEEGYDPTLPPAIVLPNTDSSLFWKALEGLLDTDELCRCGGKRDGLLELLNSIFARRLIIEQDAMIAFLREGLTDKRLGRKFVTTRLMDLYKIMASTSSSPLVASLVAKMALALDPADRLYECFLDEIYGNFHGLSSEEIMHFLTDLLEHVRMPLLTAEFCLMLGERRFCLGSSRDRTFDLLARTDTFCEQLHEIRVEGRRGTMGRGRADDTETDNTVFLFRILSLLVVSMIQLLHKMKVDEIDPSSCMCTARLTDIRRQLVRVQKDVTRGSRSHQLLKDCIGALGMAL